MIVRQRTDSQHYRLARALQWSTVAGMTGAGALAFIVAFRLFYDQKALTVDVVASVCLGMTLLVGAMVSLTSPPKADNVAAVVYTLLFLMVLSAGVLVTVSAFFL